MTSSSTGMVASTAVAPTSTTSAEPDNSPRARTVSILERCRRRTARGVEDVIMTKLSSRWLACRAVPARSSTATLVAARLRRILRGARGCPIPEMTRRRSAASLNR
jgi:hypothetical protein